MTENKTTENDETPKAAATPSVADASTTDQSTDKAVELDDEQVQAISGGFTFQKITTT